MPTSATRTRPNSARVTSLKAVESPATPRPAPHYPTPAPSPDRLAVPVAKVADVERRYAAFVDELEPTTALSLTLLKRAVTLAIRMEKCSERDLADVADRVSQAMAEFEAPAGVDPSEASRLRAEAGRRAAFDTSKEATLARRYEAAAERGFFRALKEFRLVEKERKAISSAEQEASLRQQLGSFLDLSQLDAAYDAEFPELSLPSLKNAFTPSPEGHRIAPGRGVDVPITIGRGR